jgi:hypothetical protein
MVVQDRFSALQNENVRLYHVFEMNGSFINPPEAPSVRIVDKDGVGTLGTISAIQAGPGVYYIDWFVPIGLSVGRYYDEWTFRFTSNDTGSSKEITYFEVYPKDSIINFSSSVVSQRFSDAMQKAIRDLGNYFIYEVQHLPLYAEQAQRTGDGLRRNFTYKNWNQDPRPIMRINNRIVNDGWYTDYNGNVFFENSLDDSDVVVGSYNFAYFSPEDLAGFINIGISAMNSLPPPSSYMDIQQIPMAWLHGVLLYASIQALRRVLLGLTTQEISIIFGDGEKLAAAREIIKAMYESYWATWQLVSSGIKKQLPMIGQIIMPEYTLPGGRARWYRYMYVSGVSG